MVAEALTRTELVWRWFAVVGITIILVSVSFWHVAGTLIVSRYYLSKSVMRSDLDYPLVWLHAVAMLICLISGIWLRRQERQESMGNFTLAVFCLGLAFGPVLVSGI